MPAPNSTKLSKCNSAKVPSKVVDYSKNQAQNFPVTESLSSVKEPRR